MFGHRTGSIIIHAEWRRISRNRECGLSVMNVYEMLVNRNRISPCGVTRKISRLAYGPAKRPANKYDGEPYHQAGTRPYEEFLDERRRPIIARQRNPGVQFVTSYRRMPPGGDWFETAGSALVQDRDLIAGQFRSRGIFSAQ